MVDLLRFGCIIVAASVIVMPWFMTWSTTIARISLDTLCCCCRCLGPWPCPLPRSPTPLKQGTRPPLRSGACPLPRSPTPLKRGPRPPLRSGACPLPRSPTPLKRGPRPRLRRGACPLPFLWPTRLPRLPPTTAWPPLWPGSPAGSMLRITMLLQLDPNQLYIYSFHNVHSIISNELAELDKQLQGPASIQCSTVNTVNSLKRWYSIWYHRHCLMKHYDKILGYIHGYCSLIGSCSTLIVTMNLVILKLSWFTVNMEDCLSVSIQICIKSNATVTYHFEQLYQLIVR